MPVQADEIDRAETVRAENTLAGLADQPAIAIMPAMTRTPCRPVMAK